MSGEKRSVEFYVLAAFFGIFVLFLYGPLSAILILSFKGEKGGLTFPLNGVSLHWFANLFERQAVGDFGGSFKRSLMLGMMVMAVTVVVSLLAGLAFRRKFRGATALFYLAVASLVVPSIIISLGIGVVFQQIGLRPSWYTSAFGAHFDMEADALLVLMTSAELHFSGRFGWWILCSGVLRYVYVLCVARWPPRGGAMPRTLLGRSAFALVVVGHALGFIWLGFAGLLAAALGTTAVGLSFARSFLYGYARPAKSIADI